MSTGPASASDECVVLLHGLARTKNSMKPLAKALGAEGYQVVNLGYPSRKYPVETLAAMAIDPALKQCGEGKKINFVTHSLGGILVRQYLHNHTIPNLHRVVMLGPPNKGSDVVDKLGKVPGFHLLNGDAGEQLGTHPDSLPNTLGPVNFELGVIAGTHTFNPFLSLLIKGKNDGKVAVENTKVEGMKDFKVMPVTHTFMMKNKKVIEQVLYFLKNGIFFSPPLAR